MTRDMQGLGLESHDIVLWAVYTSLLTNSTGEDSPLGPLETCDGQARPQQIRGELVVI